MILFHRPLRIIFSILPVLLRSSFRSVRIFLTVLITNRLAASIRRRGYGNSFPAQDSLMHRVHVHLELLHAVERISGAVHAGQFQRGI